MLKAISRSTFDLQPVLDTLIKPPRVFARPETRSIMQRDGDLFRPNATFAVSPPGGRDIPRA